MTTTNDVWVLLETEENKLGSYSVGLIHEAKKLSDRRDGDLCAVLIGPSIERLDQLLGAHGVKHLFYYRDNALDDYDPEIHEYLVTELLLKNKPYLFLSAATSLGSDLMPRIAAKIKAPLITNCVAIRAGENMEFIKPVQNGRLQATVACRTNGTKMATLSPEVLVVTEEVNLRQAAQVTEMTTAINEVPTRIHFRGFLKADHRTIDIREAEFVIAIGKGIGTKEAFSVYERFADQIGAAIGGSRPIVDLGILPFERQVGQTGKEISPKLIILCGISGSVYFSKGIECAGTKVAINIDRNASIFKDVDLGIVADVNELIPKFIEYINGKMQKNSSNKL
jgi:electron transfer flavoprotein alpha subunit